MSVASPQEERMNAATHAAGLVCALIGAYAIVHVATQQGGGWEIAGCLIYAFTLVAVYAASTLSHVFYRPRLRHAMRIADQAMIYLFIAGSFAPAGLVWMRSGPWWLLHIAMWSVAIVGFARKAIFTHKVHVGTVSTVLYLILGWMPFLAIWPMAKTLPVGLTLWVVGGGLCYTAGIVFFYFDERVRYFHAAWHMMVIGGSVCHYVGNFLYCTGMAR